MFVTSLLTFVIVVVVVVVAISIVVVFVVVGVDTPSSVDEICCSLVAAAVAAAGASLKEVIRSPTRHVRFAAARSRIKLKE